MKGIETILTFAISAAVIIILMNALLRRAAGPIQLRLPLYKEERPIGRTAQVTMDVSSFVIIIGLVSSGKFPGLNNASIWWILFISMGVLLIKGVDKIVRLIISISGLLLFFAYLNTTVSPLTGEIISLLVMYAAYHIMIRGILTRKFDTNLFPNMLAIGAILKFTYTYWPLINTYVKSKPHLAYSGFLLLFVLLPIPKIDDWIRVLVALSAAIFAAIKLYNQIPLQNFLLVLLAIVIYFSLAFRLREQSYR